MTRNELQALKDADPFCPFTLVTASGRSYEVIHPDYLIFPPLPTGAVGEWPDFVEVYPPPPKAAIPAYLTVAHVTDVQFHAEKPTEP